MNTTIDLSHLAPPMTSVDDTVVFLRQLPDFDTLRQTAKPPGDGNPKLTIVLLDISAGSDYVSMYADRMPEDLRSWIAVYYLPGVDLDAFEKRLRADLNRAPEWYAPAGFNRGLVTP